MVSIFRASAFVNLMMAEQPALELTIHARRNQCEKCPRSVQAAKILGQPESRKCFTCKWLPRMDSNHDKVIQSRFVRLRKRARVFAALGKGADTSNVSHCISIPGCRAGQNGWISSMQQEQPRPYAVEGIAAIP